ncbi:MAG TPA: hypothetical protein VEJ63_04990, partial [Planctomycetota bacterium]|nr:hypothetical protein [Planctomycetota bacterium]
MHFAEEAYKARLKLTHIQSDKATPETFREQVLPWNRNDLIMINSSGGPYSWGLTGGNGTGEDMPVGAPCAIHVTHSGSAGELYDPESMAGRAVWGGAFWYFGSAAEPFLTAFQPSRYYAPRIMAGASLSTVFRQRAGQNFFLPWRLLIVGDPQFCLRDKPARRVGADGLIAALPKGAKTIQPARADAEARQMGEKFDVSCTAAEFTAQLRRARQLGNSFLGQGETFLASTDLKQLDARGTAMVLEELLKVDQTQKAVAVWRDASAEVKKDEVAKRVARLAAGRHMDKALAGKNLKELCQAFGDLLSTDPPRNYVERWTARAGTLAAELKADGELGAWMMSIASDARAASHKPFFLFEALKKKNEWTVEEKATSLTGFQSFVKELREDWTLGGPFKEFCDLYLAKVKDATGETLLADLRLLFPAGTEDEKKVAPHMKSLEQRMSLHQDWLILGPFKDQAAGAWEKVGPKAGAAAPDYNAVFNDGKELKWTRPFKPEQKGVVDLAKLLNPNTNVYAYGAVEVEVEKDIDGFLLIGSDDGVTAWLDGKEVHKNIVARGLQIDQDRVPVKLTAGTHTLVVCITQGGGGWEFCARFGDGEGKPLPGVKMKCPLK